MEKDDKDANMEEHTEIIEKISAVSTDTKLIIKEIETLNKMSSENYRTLRGSNGNDGLIAQVKGMRGEVDSISKTVEQTNLLLRGDGKEDPGLVGKVKELQDFKEGLSRWLAIIGGAVVLDILTRVLPKVYDALAAGLN